MNFKVAIFAGFLSLLCGLGVAGKTEASAPPPASDKVIVEKVKFKNRIGIEVVGNLYVPKDLDRSQKHAAIIFGHTFTGVKEQTSGLHAQKMAEMGYVTLAFDASFWGESGGGGYVISAAQIDHRIKAVATISMYDLGRARRQGLGDVICYEQRMKILDEIGEQRTKEFRGETRRDTLGVPEKQSANDTENTRDFIDYYRTPRAMHPNATTGYSFTSMAPMMNFFPFAQIETISPRPVLFIVGERAVSAYFSEDAYNRAAEPKELFVIPRASHVDLYDVPQYTDQSVKKLGGFFTQYLR